MLLYLHETPKPCLPFTLQFLTDFTSAAVMDGKRMMDLSFNGLGLCVAVGCFLKLGGVWRGPQHGGSEQCWEKTHTFD